MKNLKQFKPCLFLLFMFASRCFAKGDIMENKNLYSEILRSAENSNWSKIAVESQSNPDEYSYINFKTGHKHTILKNSKAQLSGPRIAISPNGKYGAFWVNDYSAYSLELIDLSSYKAKKLLTLKKGCCLSWSPDSKRIAYLTADNDAAEHTLNVININNLNVDKILNGNIDFLTEQSWSPDGNKLVYSNKNQIHSYEFSSGKSTYLVNGEWASWSPVGNRILFFDSQKNSLSLLNMEGVAFKEEPLLSSQQLGEGSLVFPFYWFPNGKYIFVGHLSPQESEIGLPYVLDIESHVAEKLPDFSWYFSSWGREK